MAPPSTSPRRWPWFFAWLLLTIYFVTPPREVFDQTLDRSNYATYAHFITHGMQWGVDVMPMPGPLGFILFGYCYSGELYGARLVGDFLLCAAFSAMLLNLVRRSAPGALRWVWLAVLLVVVPTVDDLLLDAAVLLSAMCLFLGPREKPDRWAYLGAVVLAFISLIKGTHLMMCIAVFTTAALLGLVQRQPRRVVRPLIVFVGAFLLFWVMAGQNPLNLPAFLVSTSQLASGYSLTMGLEEPAFFFLVGIVLAIGLVVVIAWSVGFGTRSLPAIATLFFITLLGFLKWKHGFVRADGHVYIFYASVAVLAVTAWLVAFTPLAGPAVSPARPWRRYVGLGLITLVTGSSVLASVEFSLPGLGSLLTSAPARWTARARYLLRPGHLREKLDRELTQVKVVTDAPQIRAQVGQDRVDFFGNEEGLILLNGLQYAPRPMGGGTFNVVNSWLQRHNEAYTLSPTTAPAWQILKLAAFDDRLPSGDDGLALRAILDCYSPVLMQRDYLLLKRVRDRPADAIPRPISTLSAPPGQSIAVPPAGPNQVVLFSVKAPLTLSGRLRSFLYRPPVLQGRFFTDHYPAGRRFVLKPAIVEQPMILSPFIEDTIDVIKFYGGMADDRVHSIVLDAAPGFATQELALTFYSASRPPQPVDTDLNELLTYDQHPLSNREPVALVTEQTGIRELSGEPITVVHAPGSITWDLAPSDQQILFNYGVIPKAYLNEGTSDGVEFNVEVLWPPTDGRVVFKHMIRPRTVEQDRGMHHTRVLLPPYEPGAQLRIRTHPGPDNDGAHDQSYISRVNFKAGPLVPEQFNGLGVIPANRQLPHDSVAAIESRPVYLLHAPNELVLEIPTGAKLLRAEIGLLPGAYTNGGNSDGVRYTAFVAKPGSTRMEIWSRHIDPVRKPDDRGPLEVTVPLESAGPGTQIIIMTDVGPNGDRGWDQSYIAQVSFE